MAYEERWFVLKDFTDGERCETRKFKDKEEGRVKMTDFIYNIFVQNLNTICQSRWWHQSLKYPRWSVSKSSLELKYPIWSLGVHH